MHTPFSIAFRATKASALRVLGLVLVVLWSLTRASAAEPLKRLTWSVDGVTREALVHVPDAAKTNPAPVVFAFHGHGGSMRNAARMLDFHTRWPEAIVVYMQGLNTPGRITDPEGKRSGWQGKRGEQNDRDLKFFDAVLATLQKSYKVDSKRIYATGHSNGGVFTYLLWAARADKFAAFAPSAAVALDMPATPKPVFHAAGEKDGLVKFAWQTNTIAVMRRLNECGPRQAWHAEKNCTLFPSERGTPVVTFIHEGAHGYAPRTTGLIVRFFKEHKLP